VECVDILADRNAVDIYFARLNALAAEAELNIPVYGIIPRSAYLPARPTPPAWCPPEEGIQRFNAIASLGALFCAHRPWTFVVAYQK
jgi:hypothetical protein